MAVLMTAHIRGVTKEMVDGLRPLLGPIRTVEASSPSRDNGAIQPGRFEDLK
jgi:hypothetical protein